MEKPKVNFMTVANFKVLINATSIEILVDKESGNKSFKHNDSWFKVQKDLDTAKPMSFIADVQEDGNVDWMGATLINIDDSKAKKQTFASI
jgi:spore coat protein CotH